MQQVQVVRKRIKSLETTRQITEALNFVSAVKLKRAGDSTCRMRQYAELATEAVSAVALRPGIRCPFFRSNAGGRALIISIASDKGLCGAYNADVFRACLGVAEQKGGVFFITVGDKIRNRLTKDGLEIHSHFKEAADKPGWRTAEEIGKEATRLFLDGEAAEVHIVYTRFRSATSFFPKSMKLLPVDTGELPDTISRQQSQMCFEPSEEEVLSAIVPRYINVAIYGALADAYASQQAARMYAMGAATESAKEMLEDCDVLYNRARQAHITREIIEITGAD